MVDASQIKKIVSTAQIDKDDLVIEIGPGIGSLTIGLLNAGAKVLAIEIDSKLAQELKNNIEKYARIETSNLTVIQKDALELSPSDLEPYYSDYSNIKLVSNLPYNVGVPIILTLLQRFKNIQGGLILVQDEVAQRLTALPNSKAYGIPSVKFAYYTTSHLSHTIPRSAFYPVPRVDSKLVSFKRHNKFLKCNAEAVFPLINLAFSQRRKTLKSLLKQDGHNDEKITNILDSLQIDPLIRGESLSVEQFIEISQRLEQ